VTDMSALFWYAEDFNDDLSQWDTSSVTDMHWMFFHARSFNSDINMWDTKAVVDMGSMFNNAHAFNCELNNWNTSSVTFMLCMFTNARAFSCDISEWDIHGNAETRGAFFDCPVDYREFWIAHRGDLVWKEQCRQDRELRREHMRVQIKRDANWERRKDWIAVISPFLKLEGVTESPLQVVFDVQGIARLITSFL
jgi:surface protein